MASGLFALLDDIAAIAKVAAASVDDVAAQAVKTSAKAAGIVIDDAAVTPRYVVGFAANRELPIISKIAWGSLKNKLLVLLPVALLLTWLAPWAITPLLMIGGAYLCFEGYEKVHELLHPPVSKPPTAAALAAGKGTLEDRQVASAIRTDFILSAEIMAISLASLPASSTAMKAVILAVVGLLVTVMVYGAVALIVKADDVGLAMAQRSESAFVRQTGRALVRAMPGFLTGLSFVGMVAMLWVGGGIILHGLSEYGLGALPHAIHAFAVSTGGVFGPLAGVIAWLVDAVFSGVLGLLIGWIIVRVMAGVGAGGH